MQQVYYTYNSPTEQQVQVSRDFVNDVGKSSDGRLKITLFTYGELPFKPNEVVRAVATNKVHMGTGGIPFHEGDIPELNVYSQPFVCTSYQGYAATLPYVEPIIEKYMRDKFKVSVLMHYSMPPQEIWTVASTKRLDDLKGRKIRIWSPIQQDMLSKLGASAVTIAGAEVPGALQRKVIDGAITSALSVADWKIYEALDGGIMLDFMMGPHFTVVNLEEFNKLPPDLRRLLVIKGAEYSARYRAEIELMDARARKVLIDNGLKLNTPTSEDMKKAAALMKPTWEAWTKQQGPVAAQMLQLVERHCAD